MTRLTAAVALLLVAVALGAVLVSAASMLRRDRAELVRGFAAERQRQIDQASIEIKADFDRIGDDLRLAARLVQTTDSVLERERELAALIGVARQYRAIELRAADNDVLHTVIDPSLGRDLRGVSVSAATEQTAARALQKAHGKVATSPTIPGDESRWFRVFATALPPARQGEVAVISVLVDTRGYFDKLRILAAESTARTVVLGAYGSPTPITDEALAEAIHGLDDRRAELPGFSALVDRMRARERSSILIAAEEAARLGMGKADLVAAYAPIRVEGGDAWSIATLTSTASLREHERATTRRMVLVVSLIALFLAAIGGFIVVMARRAIAVREQLRHASRLANLQSQLLRSEKLATVGALAAGIAHEIGTPLGIVRGRAEYMAGKLDDTHPHAAGLRVIVEQIDHVTRTIRQLLDFSRVKAPAVKLVELAPVADAVAELLRFEAERRKVRIRVEVDDGVPPLAADRDQLQQVLVNLTMNACDACEGDGGTVLLRGSLERAESGASPVVRIEVVDDGCGIPEEHRNLVFDPFYTTKKRGQGTGLGLTIVAQIARNHGAAVEVQSASEQGTRFTILWPTKAAAPTTTPTTTEDHHAA